MKSVALVLAALVAAGPLFAGPGAASARAAAAPSPVIVPGRSISGISLGMTRAHVQRITRGTCAPVHCVRHSGALRLQRGAGFYSQITVGFLGRALTSRAVLLEVHGNQSFRTPSGFHPIGATAQQIRDRLGATCYLWNPTANVPDPNGDGSEPQHCVLISPGPRYTSFKVNGSNRQVSGNDGRTTQVFVSSRPLPDF